MFENLSSERLVPEEFRAAYRQHDQVKTTEKTRRGCLFGVLFVPLFWLLDGYMYPEQEAVFGLARLVCAFLMGSLYFVIDTRFGQSNLRFLGVVILLLPTLTISYMITQAPEGATNSPYYAGLNLVLIVLAVVLDWTLWQSALCVTLVLLIYLGVVVPDLSWTDKQGAGAFANNLAFLISTGAAIVFGSRYHERVRIQEFVNSKQLEVSNEALGQETRQKEQTLVELRQAQDQLVQKEKAELLGQVSQNLVHDVGNLMQPVGNYLFKLKGMESHMPEAKRASFAETLAKIERPMSAARGVLATLQRYAHGAPQMTHECSIASVMEDALQLVRATAEEAGVELKCQIDRQFVVLGQPLDLTMVFKNLLDNAITATKAKTHVNETPTISIESRLEAGRGCLLIRDNGVGIDPEGMTKLFTRFYSTKRDGNGTGLGLVGCKATVEKLGGAITVRSEAGKFTEFTVELPLPTIERSGQ